MDTTLEALKYAIPIGTGATAVIDGWAVLRQRWLGLAPPDYGLVGRWIAWMGRGRFRHDRIAKSSPMRGERAIGWITHYATGIAFAALLLAAFPEWARHPTPAPALFVGVATVMAPFLAMQPGMGAGIAASRTANPAASRVQSLVTHAIFGLGLYAAGWATSLLAFPKG